MTLTIKGLSKATFNELLSRLDITPGNGFITGKEVYMGDREEDDITLFTISIQHTALNDFSFKLTHAGVVIQRFGVLPSFFLNRDDFEHIFIQ